MCIIDLSSLESGCIVDLSAGGNVNVEAIRLAFLAGWQDESAEFLLGLWDTDPDALSGDELDGIHWAGDDAMGYLNDRLIEQGEASRYFEFYDNSIYLGSLED